MHRRFDPALRILALEACQLFRRLGNLGQFLDHRHPALTAYAVETQVRDNSAQPRPDACRADLERPARAPKSQECFLRHIFRLRIVPQHPTRHGDNASEMARHQQTKRGSVAASDSGNERRLIGSALGYRSRCGRAAIGPRRRH
jgi:hypothetical protein